MQSRPPEASGVASRDGAPQHGAHDTLRPWTPSVYVVEHNGVMQLQAFPEIAPLHPYAESSSAKSGASSSATLTSHWGPDDSGTESVAPEADDSFRTAFSHLPDLPVPTETAPRLREPRIQRSVVLNEAPRTQSMHATPFDEWSLPIAPLGDEAPAAFGRRLYGVSKAQPELGGSTASMLASASHNFLMEALDAHLARFRFEGHPIDMALRELLAFEQLPTESQQIDRVLSAFARRYAACNVDILTVEQAYMLAFSLLVLHTCTFNRHVRQRMSKNEYLSFAQPCGVESAVLEYLYDNVTLVEFAYTRGSGARPEHLAVPAQSTTAGRERTALYRLGDTGNVPELRLRYEPLSDALSAPLTPPGIDLRARELLAQAPMVELRSKERTNVSRGLPTMRVRVVKAGIVRRRECAPALGSWRALSSRWRTYGLVLAGTALLWFKDTRTVRVLRRQLAAQAGEVVFHPDEVCPLVDTLSVPDAVDAHMFRVRLLQGWYAVQPDSPLGATEVHEWVTSLNYVAGLGGLDGEHLWDDAMRLADTPYGTRAHVRPAAEAGADMAGSGADLSAWLSRDSTPLSSSPPSPSSPSALRFYRRAWGASSSSSLLAGPSASMRRLASMPYLSAEGDAPPTFGASSPTLSLSGPRALPAVRERLARSREHCDELRSRREQQARYARHLCLLTPLQRATRDMLAGIARQVQRELVETQWQLALAQNRIEVLAGEERLLSGAGAPPLVRVK